MEGLPEGIFLNTGILIFIVKMIWDMAFNKYKRQDISMEKNAQAIHELSLAVTELKVEIKWFREMVEELPEIKKDIANIHARLHQMNS